MTKANKVQKRNRKGLKGSNSSLLTLNSSLSLNVAVVGVGYVGLVTAACLASVGHRVIAIDSDPRKIDMLEKGQIPIFEAGLESMVKETVKSRRLRFARRLADVLEEVTIVFICVGTPPRASGDADLSAIEQVTREIAEHMRSYKLIVGKSTVPVKTGEWIKRTMDMYGKPHLEYDVASNPEFTREGAAVEDFMKPDRIVIGVETKRAEELLRRLYRPFDAKILMTNIPTAELIKHASNSFLAMKISYINFLSQICEKTGADITQISEGMGTDPRIGAAFLKPGPGYGGFCFPKDAQAFIAIADKLGMPFHLMKEVEAINASQKEFTFRKIEKALWVLKGKTLAVLGLAFKANTDDTRLSPAVEIVRRLLEEGAVVRAYDPKAMERAKAELLELQCVESPYDAMRGADALVILTEWKEFEKLDWSKVKKLLKTPTVVDARNLYDPAEMKRLGFHYTSIGRS